MAEKNSLWKNIRANRGSGKKPTTEMLRQERQINAEKYDKGGKKKSIPRLLPVNEQGLPYVNLKGVEITAPEMSFEERADKYLGYPMQRASADARLLPAGEDELDNVRHPLAGLYTANAIKDKLDPYMPSAIATGAGFVGSTAAGIGHEMSTMFGNDTRPWSVRLREAGEDIFNNTVGAGLSTVPFMSDQQKKDAIIKASYNNMLPDGYGDGNMYLKDKGGPVGEDENDIPYRPLSMPMEGYEWENRPENHVKEPVRKTSYSKPKPKEQSKPSKNWKDDLYLTEQQLENQILRKKETPYNPGGISTSDLLQGVGEHFFNPKRVNSVGENLIEAVDPTGISSWDDASTSYNSKNPTSFESISNYGSAIPVLGKIPQVAKSILRGWNGINSAWDVNKDNFAEGGPVGEDDEKKGFNALTESQKALLQKGNNLDRVKGWYEQNPEAMQNFQAFMNEHNADDYLNLYNTEQKNFDVANNNNAEWHKNWYAKRAQLPQFKEVATQRQNAYSNLDSAKLIDPVNYAFKYWAANNASAFKDKNSPPETFYFPTDKLYGHQSDTEKEINVNSKLFNEGNYNVNNKLYNQTLTHETGHQTEDMFPQEGTVPHLSKNSWKNTSVVKDPIQNIITYDDILKDTRTNGGSDVYQYQPTEARSRLDVWRQYNNIDALKDYSDEEIRGIMQKNMEDPNVPRNIKELYKTVQETPSKLKYLHNSYVSNEQQSPANKFDPREQLQQAARGGYVNKYATGGNTMKNNNQSWKNYLQYAKGGPFKNTGYAEDILPETQKQAEDRIFKQMEGRVSPWDGDMNVGFDHDMHGADEWINILQAAGAWNGQDTMMRLKAAIPFPDYLTPKRKDNMLEQYYPPYKVEPEPGDPRDPRYVIDPKNLNIPQPSYEELVKSKTVRKPPEAEYAQGGYTNPYNQYQDDAYNQYKVGGKVWQDIGSGAYGVLSGTLNTITGGLTTGIMDMGEDALQKAANKNFDPNNPEDVKAMREIESVGGAGEIAGSWLGLTVNPANVGSAVAGTGKGANDIVQASTASDDAKQWSKGISGVMQMGHSMNGMGSASSSGSTPGGSAPGAGAGTGLGAGAESAASSVTSGATTGAGAVGEGSSSFADTMTNFSGSKFGKGAKQAMPYVNQAAGMIGGNKGSLLEQGVARQDYLNSPEYLALKKQGDITVNNGINFSQGGNITNNSLNLHNTMRYKRFANGGPFNQNGINILPKSGALHHQSADGGIPFQGGQALAEGGEIIMDNPDGTKYVVSDRIDGATREDGKNPQPDFIITKDGKYKELNRSLADGMNLDLKKYTMGGLATNSKFKNDERRPYGNRAAKPHTDQIKELWQQKTEYARQRSQHDQAIAQAEEQKRMAEEQYIAAYGGRINPKKYPGLNMTKKANGGYVHNQMTQPMYAMGGNPWVPPDKELAGMGYTPDQIEAIKLADQQSPVFESEEKYKQAQYNVARATQIGEPRGIATYSAVIPKRLNAALEVGSTLQTLQPNKNIPAISGDAQRIKLEDFEKNRLRNVYGEPDESINDYEKRTGKKAEGGPVYGNPASEYVYARGGQINYTNDMYSMYAGGGPMVSNVNQPFRGPSAQNRGGMYIYPDGGMMPSEQQMMQQQQMQQQQAPQEQMQQQGGGQEQMMQMVQQVMQALMQGTPPEQIMQQLVQSGVPQEQAQQVVQMAMKEAEVQMQQQQGQQPMQGQGQQMPPQGMMASGGRLPKDILRARAEAHMSPEKAAAYVNSYSMGGQMYYGGGGSAERKKKRHHEKMMRTDPTYRKAYNASLNKSMDDFNAAYGDRSDSWIAEDAASQARISAERADETSLTAYTDQKEGRDATNYLKQLTAKPASPTASPVNMYNQYTNPYPLSDSQEEKFAQNESLMNRNLNVSANQPKAQFDNQPFITQSKNPNSMMEQLFTPSPQTMNSLGWAEGSDAPMDYAAADAYLAQQQLPDEITGPYLPANNGEYNFTQNKDYGIPGSNSYSTDESASWEDETEYPTVAEGVNPNGLEMNFKNDKQVTAPANMTAQVTQEEPVVYAPDNMRMKVNQGSAVQNTDTPWSEEPGYSKFARYGQAIPGVLAAITGMRNKKRTLSPTLMTAQTVNYEPERIVDRKESRRGFSAFADKARNMGNQGYANMKDALLNSNADLAGRISQSVMREGNTNAQLAQQADLTNVANKNQFKQLNEQMFQNSQTQALAGLSDATGKLASTAGEERKQYLQEWIAKNRLKTRNYNIGNSGEDIYQNNSDGYSYDSNGNRV